MNLNKIAENVYVLEGAVNIGIIVDHGAAILVDTGLGDTGVRKVRRWLAENGIDAIGIINTHSHADHFGGNSFLVKKFPDIKVFAPEIEDAFIRYPLLEPAFLYGAYPPEELMTGFLMAEPSPVHETLLEGELKIGGIELEIISIPGHSFNQMGVIYKNVFFVADALFVPDLIDKYRILFFVDFEMWVETLEKLKNFESYRIVLGHRTWGGSISQLVDINLKHLEEIRGTVSNCMPDPFDCVFKRLNIPDDPVSRALAGTSIKAVMKTL